MNWAKFVTGLVGTTTNRQVAESVGVSEPVVSRWKSGATKTPDAKHAAALARAYNRPVLEAFLAAGFLTDDEAKVRPAAQPDLSQLTNDELLELVRARMTEEVVGNGDHPAPNTEPDLGPVLKPHFPKVEPWEVDVAAREDRPGPKKR